MRRYVEQDDLQAVVNWCLAKGVSDPGVQRAVLRLGSKAFDEATYRYEGFGPAKISVIKRLRGLTGLGLKEAKMWAEDFPKNIEPITTSRGVMSPAIIAKTIEREGAKVSKK